MGAGQRGPCRGVERVIGSLATDQALRQRFSRDPKQVLEELVQRGLELNECERASLMALDARSVARFARTLDPRLQRIDGCGGEPWRP